MNSIRMKITYANAMSTIAVFLALGGTTAFAASQLGRHSVGTGQLKANAVTGAKVRDGSLHGSDIDASSLGQVRSAATATTAQSATSSRLAEHADSATTAERANHAVTADSAVTAASVAPPEAVRFLGAAGEPAFEGGWDNVEPFDIKAGFYRDHEGLVHLQGQVRTLNPQADIVAVLPAAYAPAGTQIFFHTSLGNGRLFVSRNGSLRAVGVGQSEVMSLDGISWRAG